MTERTTAELAEHASRMYAAMPGVGSHPTWDQLGVVTQSVWIEKAMRTPSHQLIDPWPFLFSVHATRGLVRNIPPKPRVQIQLEPVRRERRAPVLPDVMPPKKQRVAPR